MKRVYLISLSAFLLVMLSGCSDWLNTKPESEIIMEDYWQSETDVQSVVASCYRGLTEEGAVQRMILWGELRSDNMSRGDLDISTTLGRDIYSILNGEINAYNSISSWGSFYSVINYCNTVLAYAPLVLDRDKNFTQGDLLRTQAEVRAIRALCYFYLVRAFKEVPWIEDASVSDTQDYDKPKDTEETMINHILEDLLFARQYAAVDYGKTSYNKGRVTQNMVNSLLADVYLWKGDYEKCVEACDLVLADKSLSLITNSVYFSQIFYLGNSTESIFELQFDVNSMTNTAVNTLYGKSSDPTGYLAFPVSVADFPYLTENRTGLYSPFNYKVSSTVIESADDERAKDSYVQLGGISYIFKYPGVQRTENTTKTLYSYFYRSGGTPNWIIYRLSDVMLMKAEALVEINSSLDDKTPNMPNYIAAVKLVNTVYKRSNSEAADLDIANYPNFNDKRELVLRERQRELLFEGKRWFDLLRMARRDRNTSNINSYMDRKASGASSSLGVPSLDALYMPINNSELKSNPKLEQNPYYKTSSSSNR